VVRRCRRNAILNQVPMSESVVTESIVNTANPAPGSARNPMHAGGSDLRMLAQVEKWMAVIREINREQQELRFDVQAQGEPVANNASAKVESPYEIKIDESHRVLNAPPSSDGYIFYVALTIGLLATFGLAWVILNGSALPFNLASMGRSAGNSHLDRKVVSSSVDRSPNAPPAPMTDTQRLDRPQIHDTIVRDIGRDAPSEASQSHNFSSPPATSLGTTSLPPPASKQSPVAQRHTSLKGAKSEEPRTPTKLTPTPETRPTTIKGWTLRAVTDGTAVLEGPNGVWRARPGETVPGIGKVDSIVSWGNRLIVATSSGLISTP
jgi:hypothetical protein